MFNIYTSCELTDKGRSEMLVRQSSPRTIDVKVGERVILDATGIETDEDGINASVKFTYRLELNTVGESLRLDKDGSVGEHFLNSLSSDHREGTAQLALYDDGWRVEKIEFGKVIAASSYSANKQSDVV